MTEDCPIVQLALKLAPQHSTQYADLTARLAQPELFASPLGPFLRSLRSDRLGGHEYLLAELEEGAPLHVLDRLAATSECFEHYDEVGGVAGPFLRPLGNGHTPFVPKELAEARRYRGKTSEVFTRVLLNLALFASERPLDARLRVLDPLAGGGTTLFAALALGHDAAGIERSRKDVETTAAFVKEFCREARIPHREERIAKGPRRFTFELGDRADPRLLVLAEGDTRKADEVLRTIPGGARFDLVVGDLPYGIQHGGSARDLLAESCPAWSRMLAPGGALAVSWDATRLPRATIVATVAEHFDVIDRPPYDDLVHRVDRVIKRRDVVVALKR
jgi:SAM-dependent methyltransferase